jgi:hypothetical protein
MTQDELDLHIARATAELRLQTHVLDQRVNMLNRDRNNLMQERASRVARSGPADLAAVIRHLQMIHNPAPIPPIDLATAVARWLACGCTECYGSGSRDSGGQTPWGEPIWLACDHEEAVVDQRLRNVNVGGTTTGRTSSEHKLVPTGGFRRGEFAGVAAAQGVGRSQVAVTHEQNVAAFLSGLVAVTLAFQQAFIMRVI